MKQEIKSAAGLEGVLFMPQDARSDSVAALPAGCDVGVCALVCSLSAELSKHRGDDG